MNSRIWLLLIFFLILNTHLFARGNAEETEGVKLNNEWVLCVTDFDVGAMPHEQLIVANVITRKIVERMNGISYRTRISPEYAYYEEFAWSRARTTAARSLSAKQDERSLLLFRGEAGWRYKQNLARVDADIERLRAAFEEIEANAPLINNEPVFSLTAGNMNFSFPSAPRPGTENKFCTDQRADAFLAGTIVDFHGRFFVSMRLYTVYTQSFVWEDSLVFSPGDIEEALDELTENLVVMLSGNKPATIVVKTEPEDALVLINRSFASRGNTGSLEFPPGNFVITALAPEHESLTVEMELSAGELAEVQFFLNPTGFTTVLIPGTSFGGTVYNGALYIGETPLTLRLPMNVFEYIELDTFDNRRGTAVFQTPYIADSFYSVPVRTSKPLQSGRVDKARRMYYWAWGGTWITGIASWIAYHTFVGSDTALRYNYAQTDSYDQKFMDDTLRMYYISGGAFIALGAALVYEIVQMVRYVYIANEGSTPIVRPRRN